MQAIGISTEQASSGALTPKTSAPQPEPAQATDSESQIHPDVARIPSFRDSELSDTLRWRNTADPSHPPPRLRYGVVVHEFVKVRNARVKAMCPGSMDGLEHLQRSRNSAAYGHIAWKKLQDITRSQLPRNYKLERFIPFGSEQAAVLLLYSNDDDETHRARLAGEPMQQILRVWQQTFQLPEDAEPRWYFDRTQDGPFRLQDWYNCQGSGSSSAGN